MIHIGFATASVVSAKTTVDICRKVVCKIFYFRITLNALVNSPTIPYRDTKKMIKIYFKTKIIMCFVTCRIKMYDSDSTEDFHIKKAE